MQNVIVDALDAINSQEQFIPTFLFYADRDYDSCIIQKPYLNPSVNSPSTIYHIYFLFAAPIRRSYLINRQRSTFLFRFKKKKDMTFAGFHALILNKIDRLIVSESWKFGLSR